MQHARLGSTGIEVSRLCMGTATFGGQADDRASFAMLDACAARGVDFIDTADVYPLGSEPQDKGSSERIVGEWLKGKRHRFIVATKGGGSMGPLPWERGNSRKHLLDAIDASLNPLAGGLLSGKHRFDAAPDARSRFGSGKAAAMYQDRYWHEREFVAVCAFVKLAAAAGIPPVRLALAWVLAQPGVTSAILGASRADQLEDVLNSTETQIPPDLLARLDELSFEFRMGDASR